MKRETHFSELDPRVLTHLLQEGAQLGLPFCTLSSANTLTEDERQRHAAQQAQRQSLRQLHLAGEDKYTTGVPDIDCAARLHLCQARCCSLSFYLTAQDVAEGIVQWDPQEPHKIAQRADKCCVHLDQNSTCNVYAHRPAVCRRYDCRRDTRIWIDFERRIPAP